MRTGPLCDVVILCGGLGTRLRSVVSDRPKPMAMVHDRPFLAFVVEQLVRSGFQRLIFCTGYKGEWITRYFQDAQGYDARCFPMSLSRSAPQGRSSTADLSCARLPSLS